MKDSKAGTAKITITYKNGNVDEHHIDSDLWGFLAELGKIKTWTDYHVKFSHGPEFYQVGHQLSNVVFAS